VLELKAAARAIGVSEWVLRRYVAERRLPTVRYPSAKNGAELHGRVLIAVADLRAFVTRYRDRDPLETS
jgi:hypothetical protein